MSSVIVKYQSSEQFSKHSADFLACTTDGSRDPLSDNEIEASNNLKHLAVSRNNEATI